jgi:hypothetical protein
MGMVKCGGFSDWFSRKDRRVGRGREEGAKRKGQAEKRESDEGRE